MAEFTRMQRRMIDVLEDGLPHSASELHACLEDTLAPMNNISAHLTAIRKLIRPEGFDVICHRNGVGPTYRLVRLIQKD